MVNRRYDITLMNFSFQSPVSGKTILIISLPRHDSSYTSTPWQLATQFAKNNKVIFVDHPYTFIDLVKGFFKKPIWKRLKSYWSAPVTIRQQGVVVLLTPFVWPVNFLPKGRIYDFFSKWNQRILSNRLNTFLAASGTESLVYINSFNFYFADVHQYLRPEISVNVYHCIDPMIKPFTLKHGPYLQERAAQQADVVVSTAPELQNNFVQKGYQKSFLVPNGTDFNLFNIGAAQRNRTTKGRKKIGYLGNIERRIDYQLLLKALELLPDWELSMVGPVDKQYVPAEFRNHERVRFYGPVSYQDAPLAVSEFDVAIIPFKSDKASKSIFPLKLYEYMAAGKPVVATNFNPEIFDRMPEGVAVANDATSFAQSVQLVYATDTEAAMRERIRVASENSWEQRAQAFAEIIAEELNNKKTNEYVS